MQRASQGSGRLGRLGADARSWQIAVLASLLAWNLTLLSLGASLAPSLAALAGTLSAQAAISVALGRHSIELRSALITGLSLSLLLRTDALWLQAAAGALAIGSKVLIRIDGKHLFNPAAVAILIMLWSGHGWVSPGQWGQSLILASAIASLGLMVLARAERLDVALCFAAVYAALLLWRAIRLGDPVQIPLHQLQSGALVLFCCFMITDPKTTPDARSARLLYGVVVALLAHWLIFVRQVPSGLYVALVLSAALVPLLDYLMPAERFSWRSSSESPA